MAALVVALLPNAIAMAPKPRFGMLEAAAQALIEATDLGARDIVERSLGIAADICIYTNRNLTIEEL